jgi:hypothetical protein
MGPRLRGDDVAFEGRDQRIHIACRSGTNYAPGAVPASGAP